MTSNPTNGWNLRRVKADTSNLRWADYPTVGFNKDWIVVQANMGSISNGLSKVYLLQSANGNTNGSGYLRLFSITGAVGSETLTIRPE